VDLSDLTPAEANALAERLAPMLGYWVCLTDRMQKRGWQADDRGTGRRGTRCTS
jgi:hypothetical protein